MNLSKKKIKDLEKEVGESGLEGKEICFYYQPQINELKPYAVYADNKKVGNITEFDYENLVDVHPYLH